MPRPHICADARVSRGVTGHEGLLDLEEGQKRRRRQRVYGTVLRATDHRNWLVHWSDGTQTVCTSAQLQLEHPLNAVPVTTPPVAHTRPRTDAADDDDAAHVDDEEVADASSEEDGAQSDTGDEDSDGEIEHGGTGGDAAPAAADTASRTSGRGDDHATKRQQAAAAVTAALGTAVTRGGTTWTVVEKVEHIDPALNLSRFSGLTDLSRVNNTHPPISLFLHLLWAPLAIMADRINQWARNNEATWKDVTERELGIFFGLIIGASVTASLGESNWGPPSSSLFNPGRDFGLVMSLTRFKIIRKYATASIADSSVSITDDWWRLRAGVDEFNAVRRSKVAPGGILVVDESMSPWQPRQTKTGGLPHLSFIARKPTPHGTEFKSSTAAGCGLLLGLEIMEGKEQMKSRPHADSIVKAGAAFLQR